MLAVDSDDAALDGYILRGQKIIDAPGYSSGNMNKVD
jgi:hypothetical protein